MRCGRAGNCCTHRSGCLLSPVEGGNHGSSIAVLITSSTLNLRRVTLRAGNGADGSPGADGTAHPNYYAAWAPEHGRVLLIVRSCLTLSPRTAREPPVLRARLPSYFVAMPSRYHRRMVSGVASDAISASSLRPSGFPAPARSRRSASENRRRRGPRRARSTRFSVRKTRSLGLVGARASWRPAKSGTEAARRTARSPDPTQPGPSRRTYFGENAQRSSLGQYGQSRMASLPTDAVCISMQRLPIWDHVACGGTL